MSQCVRAVVGAALLSLAFAGCSGSSSSGGNVASVNGQDITRADYDAKLEAGPQGKSVLTQLVQGALIDQYAKDNKIDIGDAAVDAKIDEYKSKYPAGQFDNILKSQNLTLDDVKKIVRQQLIVQKAVDANIKVSDADVQAYLDKNHATLDTPDEVQAKHILVAAIETANKVEAELKGGANFADEAKKYSTDPSSKDKGGDLGFFKRGQMVPAFEKAAFSQPIGAVGRPVKSPFGFHIIVVEAKKPKAVATLANSADKIKTQLMQTQEQQQIPQFLAGLRSKATINIFDDKLKDALPPAPAAPAATPAGTPAGATPAAASAAPSAAASTK